MRDETRYPVIFAELSSKFYLLLGGGLICEPRKNRNEFPKFSAFNVCSNGCNIFNVIAEVTKGQNDYL